MKRNLLVFIFVVFLSFSLASCKNKTQTITTIENESTTTTQKEKTKPGTPVITLNDDFTISWDKVSGTSYYVINVNGVDNSIKETNNSYKVKLEPGTYSIKVKSVNSIGESEYSNTISYSVSSIEVENVAGSLIDGENIHVSGTTYKLRYSLSFDEYDYTNSYVVIKDSSGTETNRIKLEDTNGVLDIDSISADSIITIEGIVSKTFKLNYSESELFSILGDESIEYNGSYKFKVKVEDCASYSTPIVEIDGVVSLPNEEGYFTLNNVKHNPIINVSGLKKNVYTTSYAKNDAIYTVAVDEEVEYGDSITLKININESFIKQDTYVSVNGKNVGKPNETIIIKDIKENQSIEIVNLNLVKYSITYTKGTGYKLTGIENAYEGSYVGVTLELDDAYNRSNAIVKANGVTLTKENDVYMIEGITENTSITVTGIEKNRYTISTDGNEDFTYSYSNSVIHGGSIIVGVETLKKFSRIDLSIGDVMYTSDDGEFLISNVTDDIVLKAIGYTPKEEFLLNSAYTSYVTISDNKVSANSGSIVVNADLISSAIAFGYDSLKMNIESSTGYFALKSNGKTVRLLTNESTLRINLDWVKNEFVIEAVNKQGVKQNADIVLSNIDCFNGNQSSFKKSNSLVYAAYENGSAVMDSYGIDGLSFAYTESMPFESVTLSNVVIEDESGNVIYMCSTSGAIDKTNAENHIVLKEKENGYNLDFIKYNNENSFSVSINQNDLKQFISLKVKGVDTTIDASFAGGTDYTLNYKGISNSFCGIDLESIRDANSLKISINGELENNSVEISLTKKDALSEFYSIAAWGELNGGTIYLYDDYMIVDKSWQLNMVSSWLSTLKSLGYRKIEFDISVSGNTSFIQCNQTGEYLSEEPNATIRFKMSTESIVWLRGKTALGTTYGDNLTIHSGNFRISNFKAYDTVDLGEEFYESSTWSNLNGGTFSTNGNSATIRNSWQVELSESYLNEVTAAGYKAIEFDIKLESTNITAIQLSDGTYLQLENGIYHIRWVTDNGKLVFRGKTKAEGSYQENAESFNIVISNVTFDTNLKEGEENIFKTILSNLNGGKAVYGNKTATITASWQLNISKEYCASLYDQGYKTFSFDIELKDPNLYLAMRYYGNQEYLEKTADGKYHLEIDLYILKFSEYYIRCKKNNTSSFDDSQSILSFGLTLTNPVLA